MEELTIKDIARLCGVGVSTVSRAINNHPDINARTKAHIMDVIQEHHYIPNNSARNLKRLEANSIAVLVKGITNPFFTDMIDIMSKAIAKHRYSLVLQHVDLDDDEIDVALELIKEKRLRGLVFLGGHFSPAEAKLKKITIPFVLCTIGGKEKSIQGGCQVSVNDVVESKKVVQYLIDKGHKDIAIVCAKAEDASISALRLEGYMEALADNNIPFNPDLVVTMSKDIEAYSIENGYDAGKNIVKSIETSATSITAIFAISDMLAIGVCKAILDAGYKVPDDFSIIGFDGIHLGEYYNPSISTLKQPVSAIAKTAMELLFDCIDGEIDNEQVTFDGEIVERQSTAPYRREK